MTMPTARSPALSLEELRRLAAGDEAADQQVLRLLHTMQLPDEELRAWTSDALGSVRVLPQELIDPVARMCLSASPQVAAAACNVLAKARNLPPQFQAPIVACLTQHQDISARQQAALALSSIGQLTSATREALHAAAQSSDPRLKRLAQAALEQADK